MRKRYFIRLAYNGASYHGWQYQKNAKSIQETLNNALERVLKEDVNVTGCGRTDTGVNALNYYAHFDVSAIDNSFLKEIPGYLNTLLPGDIAIYNVFPVKPDAHARFDAIRRTYRYQISLKKDPFVRRLSWYVFSRPDIYLMNECAALLMDFSDFRAFSKGIPEGTGICRISEARWNLQGHLLIFTITADRFLRNMVRAIAGTLLDVGLGKTDKEGFINIIKSHDRRNAGLSVPARGLALTDVVYPESIYI